MVRRRAPHAAKGHHCFGTGDTAALTAAKTSLRKTNAVSSMGLLKSTDEMSTHSEVEIYRLQRSTATTFKL